MPLGDYGSNAVLVWFWGTLLHNGTLTGASGNLDIQVPPQLNLRVLHAQSLQGSRETLLNLSDCQKPRKAQQCIFEKRDLPPGASWIRNSED